MKALGFDWNWDPGRISDETDAETERCTSRRMDVGSALKKNCVDDGVRLPLNRAGCGHRATLIGLLERAKLDDL
jgi:hypothetical protein